MGLEMYEFRVCVLRVDKMKTIRKMNNKSQCSI